MAKSDLLKEAIADAKAVKETALANAKIALQEAFAPRMMRMISDQIENEVEGEEELPAEAPLMDAGAGEQEEGDDFTWTDDSLSASVGGNDYNFTVGIDGEDEMPEDEMPEDEMQTDEEMTAEYNEGMYMEDDMGMEDGMGMEDDAELQEIIRELEGDVESSEDLDMPVEGMEMDDPSDLDEYRHDPSDLDEYGHENTDIDEIIESILRESEHEEAPTPEADVEGIEEELEDTKEELEEAYRTVKHLKSIINEVNLLNAKLLYTNKLFRNFELSEGQKMKVIENFDRAGNPREVKLVFTTLAESFQRPTKKRVVKESKSYASRPIASTAPSRATTQVLNEGFELANRWKKLAGLL